MGSSPRKGCRSALRRPRRVSIRRRRRVSIHGIEPAEGCRSALRRPRRVSIRGVERTGTVRSASPARAQVFDPPVRADWKGLDPRARRPRRVSIHGADPAGRVSIRAPGAREGCRSMAWIGPEGCRSARPATPKGLDPRDRTDRICSIRAPGDRASVRSARAWSRVQVFDPPVRADRKGVDPRARRPRRVSIHGMDRAGGVSIRASGDSEGSRSAPPETAQVFDPCVRQVFDPRLRRLRKCSIRAPGKCSIRRFARAGRVSIRAPGAREGCRSMARIGSEGCRSVRPATPKGSRSRGSSASGGVRSAVSAPAQVFDPWHGAGRICSIRAPGDRANVRSAGVGQGASVRFALRPAA